MTQLCRIFFANETNEHGVYRPVHGILGLREKLLDRIPMKLLGKEEYTRFEKDFIISLVGPRQ